MAEQQDEETIGAALITLEPLVSLNNHRAQLGLPPTRNLISSAVYMEGRELQRNQGAEGQQGNSASNQGGSSLRRNDSTPVPEELNCRLWITGLPGYCTVNDLLRNVSGIGPILSCHVINPVKVESQNWETAAASLTFFSASAANLFLQQCAVRPLMVGSNTATVVRHRVPTESVEVNGQSRVLRIVGEWNIVSPGYLNALFSENWGVQFVTDYMNFHPQAEGRHNVIIWAFASFQGQAQIIFNNLSRNFVGQVRVTYMADPCV
ncbi:hypothetical protein F4825DRAFT_471842 [Nemania diffusa]|nr:hypothetical protein F4825DRAFT_471842 [Nemania diffusa]